MNLSKAIRIDFKDTRVVRQILNNKNVYQSILDNNPTHFHKNINKKELERQLKELQWDFKTYWNHLREDLEIGGRAWHAARNLAINAARQGTKDETTQLDICGNMSKKYKIIITKLPNRALRPTKDGKILSKSEIETMGIPIDCCLKSFDAKIEGEGTMNGVISAKISFGGGGHQDNVFREQDEFAKWWCQFKSESSDFLVLLIDSDLQGQFNRIKEKYKDTKNVLVMDHYEFQEYIMKTYPCETYPCESM